MLEGPLVFVDIDTQRDFLEPDGALFVPGSERILDNLARLTRFARDHRIPVLATACAHHDHDPELADFGRHCMAGSRGAERVGATSWAETAVLATGASFAGELPEHLTLEKRELSLFSHPDADRVIERYNRDRPTFVVYGVATDYCVNAAVHGLIDRGARVAVVVDAVRAIDPQGEADVLRAFTQRGAVLVLTSVVCDE